MNIIALDCPKTAFVIALARSLGLPEPRGDHVHEAPALPPEAAAIAIRAVVLWEKMDVEPADRTFTVIAFGRRGRPARGECQLVPVRAARALICAGADVAVVEPKDMPPFVRVHLGIRNDIVRFGWSVIAVGSSYGEPNFCYTVGLTEKGLPELIAFGLGGDVGHALLNQVARDLVAREVRIGARIRGALCNRDGEDIDVILRTVPKEAVAPFAVQAINVYKDSVCFVMAVHPDRANRFPWDHGFNETLRSFQPAIWRPDWSEPSDSPTLH